MYSLKLKIRLELHPFNNNGVIVHLKVLGLEIVKIFNKYLFLGRNPSKVVYQYY
jgi:hypothetical protein